MRRVNSTKQDRLGEVAGAGVRDPLMLEHLDPTLALVVGGGGEGGAYNVYILD